MTPTFTDRYISVDDLNIRYWDEGTGTPLLLVHGVGVTADSWAFNIEALAARYRVIAFDIPGFGKSSRSSRSDLYSLEYAGQFMKRFVNDLGITKLSVVGNSLGGMLVIQFVLMYPEMIDKLVLVDSAGLGKEINLSASIASIRPIGELLIHPSRMFIKTYAKALLYRKELVTDEFVEQMLEVSKTPGTKEAMLRIIRIGVNRHGQFAAFHESDLGRISSPTLVVWGKYDSALPAKHAEAALRAIPNCRAIVLDKAGHAPQMDRPEIFNQLMLEFLGNGVLAAEKTQSTKELIFL